MGDKRKKFVLSVRKKSVVKKIVNSYKKIYKITLKQKKTVLKL